MIRKQEEGAENGFKLLRFFPSAGKTGFGRKEKVPKRARGGNKGQRRARGSKDKDRNSRNSYKKDHQCKQCDPEGTCVSKPLLPHLVDAGPRTGLQTILTAMPLPLQLEGNLHDQK